MAEGHGPYRSDTWCRVARINPTAHICRDNPSKYCHVITLRAGPRDGTYLKVDTSSPDRNNQRGNMRDRQSGFFGADTLPRFNSEFIKEMVRGTLIPP